MKKAYVIGSGPNGLTAAIELARAGKDVAILEAEPTIGGGTRSAELTLPGFIHDVCSAVHPMALSSPAFASYPLHEHGLEWIHSPSALAHPLPDGSCALLNSCAGNDAAACWRALAEDLFAPPHWPEHPLLFARFGLSAAWPAAAFARAMFRTPAERALFAGNAAHSMLPLDAAGTAAYGLVLSLAAKAVGWPIARGGSQRIAAALRSYLESLGGKVYVNCHVRSLAEFESDALVFCDVTPRQLIALSGNRLPESYLQKLAKARCGPGVFKLDWALSGPIPWRNTDCTRAATVHIGGTLEQIADAERAPWRSRTHKRPFVLLAQPSLFDSSRAPAGQHTAWAYCHVPHGSHEDMTEPIEAQIERYAPGFTQKILVRHAILGGEINGSAAGLWQQFRRLDYRTPNPNIFICSASTPPGPGVHGMCGYHAAAIPPR